MSYRAPIEGLDEAAQLEIGSAVERENHVRESLFVDGPSSVCGLPCLPLTPRRLILLDAIESPFLRGTIPDEADVVLFLWICSPRFSATSRLWKWLHVRRCRKVRYVEACDSIDRLVAEAFQDAPGGRDVAQIPKTSWLTDLVDFLASEYHWSERDILEMPMGRIFGYIKRARLRNNPKAITFNPSDRVITRVMERLNGEQKTP